MASAPPPTHHQNSFCSKSSPVAGATLAHKTRNIYYIYLSVFIPVSSDLRNHSRNGRFWWSRQWAHFSLRGNVGNRGDHSTTHRQRFGASSLRVSP